MSAMGHQTNSEAHRPDQHLKNKDSQKRRGPADLSLLVLLVAIDAAIPELLVDLWGFLLDESNVSQGGR